jgi:hypothetical protein
MNRPRLHHPVHLDPLPEDVSPGLRDLDARLAGMARRATVPMGLAERVYQASAAMLPQATATHLRYVPVPIPRRALHQTAWARLAMAACFVLACTVAVALVQRTPVVTPGGSQEHFVLHQPQDDVDQFGALAWALQPTHLSSWTNPDTDPAFLLETIKLTGEDLRKDVTLIVSRF